MTLSYRQTEDTLQIFYNNKHVGYVDEESMLNLFNKEGHSVPIQNIESRAEIRPIVTDWMRDGEARYKKKLTLTKIIEDELRACQGVFDIETTAKRIAVKILSEQL